MDEFITRLIDETYRPKWGMAAAKSVFESGIMTLIGLPFGFFGWRLSVPKRRAQIKSALTAKLYAPFGTTAFEDRAAKVAKNRDREEYVQFLDSLPGEYKLRVLMLALQNPKKYRDLVMSNSWREKKAA